MEWFLYDVSYINSLDSKFLSKTAFIVAFICYCCCIYLFLLFVTRYSTKEKFVLINVPQARDSSNQSYDGNRNLMTIAQKRLYITNQQW